jgi:hypothetical protein
VLLDIWVRQQGLVGQIWAVLFQRRTTRTRELEDA